MNLRFAYSLHKYEPRKIKCILTNIFDDAYCKKNIDKTFILFFHTKLKL